MIAASFSLLTASVGSDAQYVRKAGWMHLPTQPFSVSAPAVTAPEPSDATRMLSTPGVMGTGNTNSLGPSRTWQNTHGEAIGTGRKLTALLALACSGHGH